MGEEINKIIDNLEGCIGIFDYLITPVESNLLVSYIKELQQENEKPHRYKTLYQSLKKQKEELRSWLYEVFSYGEGVVDENFIEAIENVLEKMEELESVKDE